MVRTISVQELPTIADAFGTTYRVLRGFHKIGLKDESLISPVMMLPRETLLEVPDIGASSVSRITKVLGSYSLGHRQYCQKSTDFLAEQFGFVRDAPIGVLQVTIVRSGDNNRPIFAPLDTINLLEELDPHMTLRKLLRLPPARIVNTVEMRVDETNARVRNVWEDLRHLSSRLGNLGFEYKTYVPPSALMHRTGD